MDSVSLKDEGIVNDIVFEYITSSKNGKTYGFISVQLDGDYAPRFILNSEQKKIIEMMLDKPKQGNFLDDDKPSGFPDKKK